MKMRSWMIVPILTCVLVQSAAQLRAQSADDPSPTVVKANDSSSASPFVASTLPLADVPEGVTAYYWPQEPAAKAPPATNVTPPKSVRLASYAPTTFPTYRKPLAQQVDVSYRSPLAPQAESQVVQRVPYGASIPIQTTLRPEAVVAGQSPSGGIPCICTPIGQATGPTVQGTYMLPQTGVAPTAGVAVAPNYGPVYAYRAALPVSQLPTGHYFGQGLIGQPKVYIQGQPIRNALRYVSP